MAGQFHEWVGAPTLRFHQLPHGHGASQGGSRTPPGLHLAPGRHIQRVNATRSDRLPGTPGAGPRLNCHPPAPPPPRAREPAEGHQPTPVTPPQRQFAGRLPARPSVGRAGTATVARKSLRLPEERDPTGQERDPPALPPPCPSPPCRRPGPARERTPVVQDGKAAASPTSPAPPLPLPPAARTAGPLRRPGTPHHRHAGPGAERGQRGNGAPAPHLALPELTRLTV